MMRRVQRDEFLHRHLRQFCGDLDVNIGRRADRGEIGAVGDARNAQFGQGSRIAEDVLQRLQFGNVVACFLGHGETQVIGRQILRPVPVHRPCHGPFTPVVGGQRQMPVAVHFVDRLQIIERRSR